MKIAMMGERLTGRISDYGPLFEYTIKLVLLTSFLELVLYRLVSRLGMHLSKLAATHPWITPTFSTLTEIGTWLLNIVAMLIVFVALVALANSALGLLPQWGGTPITLQRVLGYVMAPLVWDRCSSSSASSCSHALWRKTQ